MNSNKRLLTALVCASCLSLAIGMKAAEASPPSASATPRPYPERLKWWAEGRLGMFIHWGPVSLKGTEISWSRANTNPKCPNKGPIPADVYDNLYKEFDPVRFDAAEWVRIAKAGGAKYMVLTAKHCDGFLLWHSKASDYNISASPFKRDICRELSSAARQQGVRIGWYFSPMDWRDPDFRTERNPDFLVKMKSEVRELLSNYGRIDLLWFDWDGRDPMYDQAATYGLVKQLQPDIIVNNRLDLGPKNSDREILSPTADYYTPEQTVGAYDDQRPWESCMTISRSGQWAWGGSQDGVKSLDACINMVVRCVGGDGNVLLNVGPMPNGEIAPEQADRLKEIGDWLGRYGESIYGTRGGPFKPAAYGTSTRNGRTIFVHVRDWPGDSLRLPPIGAKILEARTLTGGAARWSQSDTGIEVSVAEVDRQSLDTIIALEIDRNALELPSLTVPDPVSLSSKAKATASNVFQQQPQYGADKAIDGNRETRWAADAGVHSAWLQLEFEQPVTFSRVSISEAFPNRVQKFELQAMVDGRWSTFLVGTTLGESWSRQFKAVTAQRVRFNVLDSTDGPTLWELRLFK